MFTPLITFIVPAYNVDPYIEQCIRSISNQSYKNIEILVIDDGSTDNTPNTIDRLATEDSRIIPIHQSNAGVSRARNVGIERARGEYLSFVDGDDYIAPDFAEYMLILIERTGGELCLSLNCFTMAGEKQIPQESVRVLDSAEATALLLSPAIIVGSWNKIYKRSVLIENGLRFNPNLFYGEGLCFFTLFSQLCTKVGVGNRKVYYYRRNNYRSATTKFNIRAVVNGNLAIEEIRKNLKIQDSSIELMLNLHQALYCMGAVVKIKMNRKEKVYQDEYDTFLRNLRLETPKFIFRRKVPLYRKGLLIGTCLFPALMAWLDTYRRRRIASISVS